MSANCDRRLTAGFTLMEMLVLIVVFSGSLVALLSVSRESAHRIADTAASARAMQLAQERIETVIADRHNPNRGYGYLPLQAASCSAPSSSCAYPLESGVMGSDLARSVQISDASSSASCPVPAAGCKQVQVSVTRHGVLLASLTVLLANH